MPSAKHKFFGKPDEVREFPKGKAELINIGGGVVGKLTLEPGWKWSEHVKLRALLRRRRSPRTVVRHGSGSLCRRVRVGGHFVPAEPRKTTAGAVKSLRA
jgi:hypothetical protein